MKALLIGLMLAATTVSCASAATGQGTGEALEVRVVDYHSDIPVGTLELLVAFSDLVIEFTILSEAEGQVFPLASDSRNITRNLTIRVDTVLWSTAADVGRDFPTEGEEFVFQHEGWWDNGERTFRLVSNGKELIVGGQYFGAFSAQPTAPTGIVLANYASLYGSDGRAPIVLGGDDFPGFAGTDKDDLIVQFAEIAGRPEVAIFAGKSDAERQQLPLEPLGYVPG